MGNQKQLPPRRCISTLITYLLSGPHHAEALVNPNPLNQKMVTDFGYPNIFTVKNEIFQKIEKTTFFGNFLPISATFVK
jgi:hypothetical protein